MEAALTRLLPPGKHLVGRQPTPRESHHLRRRFLDAWAADEACKAAVKMHEPLSPDEMRSLVGELFACEQPWACPHGRPIVLELTDADLERRFGRR